MSKKQRPENKSGRIVDLSTGKKGKTKKTRKGPAPIIQQSINLSTPKPEKTDVESPSTTKKTLPPSRPNAKEKKRPRSKGNSLAELLDPETLKKLRG